jgi:hypothetical protein
LLPPPEPLRLIQAATAAHEPEERILKPFRVMSRVGQVALDPATVYASARERSLSIEVELFPGERHVFDFNRTETSLAGSVSWNGTLRSESDEGYLTLTASPSSVSGIVQTGLRRYVLRSFTNLHALVGEVDPRREAKCLMPEARPETENGHPKSSKPSKPSPARPKTSTEVIDLVVYFTPEAAANYYLNDPTVDIDSLVADMNTSFSDSGVAAEIRAIHYEAVDVDNPTLATDFFETWDELRTDQGNLSHTTALRENSGGDLVMLLVDSGSNPGLCGTAGSPSILTPLEDAYLSWPENAAAQKAFAIVTVTCAAADLTFTHELGHELGGWHGFPLEDDCGINDESCGYPRLSSPYFRTIMSSGSQAGNFECTVYGCPRINRWSNYGKNIVISSTSYPLGTSFVSGGPNEANELTINDTTAAFVADYHSATGSAPGSVSGIDVVTCCNSQIVTWNAASGYPGWYEVQRSSYSNFSGAVDIYSGAVRERTFSIGVNFYLRVRACNTVGCGSWSASGLNEVSQCF